MFAGNKAQILVTLDTKIFQYNLQLVVLAYHVILLPFLLLFILLVLFIFVAWRQREARITLKQIPDFMKFLLKLSLSLIILDVLQQLINYTPETPQIGCLIVRFLNQRNLRRSVPS
jgi:hypothetical protein